MDLLTSITLILLMVGIIIFGSNIKVTITHNYPQNVDKVPVVPLDTEEKTKPEEPELTLDNIIQAVQEVFLDGEDS